MRPDNRGVFKRGMILGTQRLSYVPSSPELTKEAVVFTLVNDMFRRYRKAWKTATVRKPPDHRVRLSDVEAECRLGSRIVPSRTTISLTSIPDAHVSAADTSEVLLDFTARTTGDGRAYADRLVVDDLPQGALGALDFATLYREVAPNAWLPLRTVPVTGDQIVFNGFGRIRTSGAGAHFQVRGDADDALVGDVRMELGVVSLRVPYGGQQDFTVQHVPGSSDGPRVLQHGGVVRTNFWITSMPPVTLTAGSTQVVAYDYYAQSSHPLAFARCARFDERQNGMLQFVRRGTLYLEVSPGVWTPLQTVRPTDGRLVFSGIGSVPTAGAGVHLQVRLDAVPTMIGSVQLSLGLYKMTMPYAGSRAFVALNPPQAEPPHGQVLTVSSVFYDARPGSNVVVGDFTVGIGEHLSFDTLELRKRSGSFLGMTNIQLRRLDANDNVYGPALGTVTLLDDGRLIIDNIDTTIFWSEEFRLTADLLNSVQIDEAIPLS